jgi:hypothetical protein
MEGTPVMAMAIADWGNKQKRKASTKKRNRENLGGQDKPQLIHPRSTTKKN